MAVDPDQKYALKGSQIKDVIDKVKKNISDISDLDSKIQALATDFSYKGSVADYAHLPNGAAIGDVYTTLDTGVIYVWDGNQWVALNEYPPVFVGTDGTTPGTVGLVPAPTAAEAGKVLSANGGWVDNDNFYDVKVSVRTDKTYRELKTAWEAGKVLRFGSNQGVFWFWQKGFGSTNTFPITWAAKRHNLYTLQGEVTYNGTGVPAVIKLELYMNSTGSDWEDQPLSSSAEPIANLQPAGLDATTPDYKIPSITVLKNALAEKEPITIVNAGAPTTSTAAVGVGQQYYDSTNNKLYYCSAITAQGTDPETYTYTWSSFGPNVVQTTGTSTTDVMSQNATTEMVFADPGTNTKVRIGSTASTGSNSIAIGPSANAFQNSIAIGKSSYAAGTESIVIGTSTTQAQSNYSVALGCRAMARSKGSVAIGQGSDVTGQGVVGIGIASGYGATYGGYNNTDYRLLTGLYDPQNAHDAATKGYADTKATITMTSTDPGEGGALAENNFIAVYNAS